MSVRTRSVLVVAALAAAACHHRQPSVSFAGSSLLAKSVPIELRPSVQGTSDLMMNGAGAVGGAIRCASRAVLPCTTNARTLEFAVRLPDDRGGV